MSNLTIYENSFDNVGYEKPITITEAVELIKGERFKKVTDGLRKIENPRDAYSYKRSNFAAATFSGTFSQRNSDSLIQHSGLICLDIDKLDQEKLDSILATIPKDSLTHVLFISPSGNGVKLIVKIDCTDGKAHKDIYFPSLVKYYKEHYDIDIDKSGSNVDRLCYLPYDPNVYYNPDSDVFYSDLTEDDFIIASRNSFEHDKEYTIKNIEFCISELHRKKIDITTVYAEWVRIGFAFASLGETGRQYYHKISALYPGYTEEQTDKKFNNYLAKSGGKINIATFFFACKEAGVELTKSPVSVERAQDYRKLYADIHDFNRNGVIIGETQMKFLTGQHLVAEEKITTIIEKIYRENEDEFNVNNRPEIFQVQIFLKKNYDIYKNEITGITQFKRKKESKFITINKNTIFCNILEAGYKFSFEKLKALLGSDFIPVINPFVQYFESLPAWDKTDHITALADHVQTDNPPFWREMFKKALVRSIACAIAGRENRIIMVLVQQDQETGKTNFIRFLNPFGDDYYTESPLRDSKDIEFRFAENFIYNLEELSSLHALDINKLKAIISKSTVKERRAYAEYEEKLPRRCSFWASTNKPEFLTDTQNSRWLCFNVVSINHDYNNLKTGKKNVDINKVWAQAMHLLREGFDYDLTADEKTQRDEANKQYEQSSSEKELIQEHFKATEGYDDYMTLAKIEETLLTLSKGRMRLHRAALGRALLQLGYKGIRKRVDKYPTTVYYVKLITPLTPKPTIEEETPF